MRRHIFILLPILFYATPLFAQNFYPGVVYYDYDSKLKYCKGGKDTFKVPGVKVAFIKDTDQHFLKPGSTPSANNKGNELNRCQQWQLTHVKAIDDSSNYAIRPHKSYKVVIKGDSTIPVVYDTYNSDTVTLNFYEAPDDKKPSKQLKYYMINNQAGFQGIHSSWFSNHAFSKNGGPGEAITFLCKRRKGKWYEVIVNEHTMATMWIHKSSRIIFCSLDEEIKCYGPIAITNYGKIYTNPDLKSPTISYDSTRCLEAMQVKGDWVKVSNPCDGPCCFPEDTTQVSGWIKFKEQDKLLVNIFSGL